MHKLEIKNKQKKLHESRMLLPAAYSESLMPSLRLTHSSRFARRIGKFLLFMLICTVILMAFAPWQQSVTGSGNVVAYAPRERRQVIESPIKGRIVRWDENLVENARVTKGQFLVEIQDLDADYVERLNAQLLNTERQVFEVKNQLEFDKKALKQQEKVIESFELQLATYKKIKEQVKSAQDSFVEMAEKKVQAEQQQLSEYEVALPQLEAELNRTEELHREGNIALQKLQEIQRKFNEAKAKVKKAEAYVAAAKAELEGKQSERNSKVEKAQVDIDYAESNLGKAQSEASKLESTIAKTSQLVQKTEKELLDMKVKLARQKNQVVTAPIDGIVVQITPNIGSGILKEGAPLCTIVPETDEKAVQLWLNGNDVPLVKPGRHVRLQFEGWPAVQFSGWPSIAVGTFGGEVVSIDATDDGMGKFRVLVRPDVTDEEWPEDRYLRQGVRTNGWVLLEKVPLWFEVWRQLNSFPPVVPKEESKDGKSKPPKLPK